MLELYVMRDQMRYGMMLFQLDQRLLARAMLARVLCLQGYAERAAEHARLAFKEAQASDGFTLCWVLQNGLYPVALMTGDIRAAEEALAIITVMTSQYSLMRRFGRSSEVVWKENCISSAVSLKRARRS